MQLLDQSCESVAPVEDLLDSVLQRSEQRLRLLHSRPALQLQSLPPAVSAAVSTHKHNGDITTALLKLKQQFEEIGTKFG